jgi:hypothetical protein
VERETKLKFKDKFFSRTESGYLSLEHEPAKARKAPPKKVDEKMVADTRQISKMRYFSARELRTAGGQM